LFAARRTAITIGLVAIVAFLTKQNAVAARGSTRTLTALRLVLTVRRAPVEGHGVAVFAAFGAFLDSVAALGWRANAGRSLAFITNLVLAARRTAVPGGGVAVITKLWKRLHTVATTRNLAAGLACGNARVAVFDAFAVLEATVTRCSVAIVARLILREDAVTTPGWGGFGGIIRDV
jgi:hypothetical protein